MKGKKDRKRAEGNVKVCKEMRKEKQKEGKRGEKCVRKEW